MNWKPAFAIVLLFVTLITFKGGILLDNQTNTQRRKTLVGCFTILGLFPLLVFKYYNFINNSISQGLEEIGLHFSLPGLNWAIPVGISFFTFQAVGYMLDVYHKRIEPEKNLVDYVLFVSFFPQVTSGPISKADELLPQIKNPHMFEYKQGVQGLKFLLWGMFMKLAVADRLGMYVDLAYGNFEHLSGANCLMASIFYTLQIYGDFAGYSLMAIGIARTLGFTLVDNFKRPYLATSITDFRKRWHISLTRWLTQQIYIPIGGNRCSKHRCYFNILVTFLVSGLWHGANWTFVLWGIIHGVVQVIEKVLNIQRCTAKKRWAQIVRIAVTFAIVNFAWIFFRMPTVADSMTFISKIFTQFGHIDIMNVGTTHLAILALVIPILFVKDIKDEYFKERFSWLHQPIFQWFGYLALFVIIIGLGVLDSSQFIYVSF